MKLTQEGRSFIAGALCTAGSIILAVGSLKLDQSEMGLGFILLGLNFLVWKGDMAIIEPSRFRDNFMAILLVVFLLVGLPFVFLVLEVFRWSM